MVKCEDIKKRPPCSILEDKILPCGHMLRIPCSKNVNFMKCTQLRTFTCSRGHQFDAVCFQVSSERLADSECTKAITIRLDCEHVFKGRCSSVKWCSASDCCKQCNIGVLCKTAISRIQCKACTQTANYEETSLCLLMRNCSLGWTLNVRSFLLLFVLKKNLTRGDIFPEFNASFEVLEKELQTIIDRVQSWSQPLAPTNDQAAINQQKPVESINIQFDRYAWVKPR